VRFKSLGIYNGVFFDKSFLDNELLSTVVGAINRDQESYFTKGLEHVYDSSCHEEKLIVQVKDLILNYLSDNLHKQFYLGSIFSVDQRNAVKNVCISDNTCLLVLGDSFVLNFVRSGRVFSPLFESGSLIYLFDKVDDWHCKIDANRVFESDETFPEFKKQVIVFRFCSFEGEICTGFDYVKNWDKMSYSLMCNTNECDFLHSIRLYKSGSGYLYPKAPSIKVTFKGNPHGADWGIFFIFHSLRFSVIDPFKVAVIADKFDKVASTIKCLVSSSTVLEYTCNDWLYQGDSERVNFLNKTAQILFFDGFVERTLPTKRCDMAEYRNARVRACSARLCDFFRLVKTAVVPKMVVIRFAYGLDVEACTMFQDFCRRFRILGVDDNVFSYEPCWVVYAATREDLPNVTSSLTKYQRIIDITASWADTRTRSRCVVPKSRLIKLLKRIFMVEDLSQDFNLHFDILKLKEVKS